MAIQQKENSRIVISGFEETAHTNVGIIAVIYHVEASHALQNVSESAVAEFANFVGRDDGD